MNREFLYSKFSLHTLKLWWEVKQVEKLRSYLGLA